MKIKKIDINEERASVLWQKDNLNFRRAYILKDSIQKIGEEEIQIKNELKKLKKDIGQTEFDKLNIG